MNKIWILQIVEDTIK